MQELKTSEIYNKFMVSFESFMWKFFEKRDVKYELRIKNLLQTPNLTKNTIGANSLISRGAHLWNTLPDDIKNVNSSAVFRKKIKE